MKATNIPTTSVLLTTLNPQTHARGGQHVTTTHRDATCTRTNPATPSTSSTMPNTGGMHFQSSRTESPAEQNNILRSPHPSPWRMPDPLVVRPAQDMRRTTPTLSSIWEQEASTTELASLVDEMSLSVSADSNAHPADAPLALTGNPPRFVHNAVPTTLSHPTESKQRLPLTQANLELSSSCLGTVSNAHGIRAATQAGSNSELSSYVRVNTDLQDEEIEVIILLSQLEKFDVNTFHSILMKQFGHTRQEASMLANLAAAGRRE